VRKLSNDAQTHLHKDRELNIINDAVQEMLKQKILKKSTI